MRFRKNNFKFSFEKIRVEDKVGTDHRRRRETRGLLQARRRGTRAAREPVGPLGQREAALPASDSCPPLGNPPRWEPLHIVKIFNTSKRISQGD